MRKLPKIIDQKTVANSKLFSIEQVHLEFANGTKRIFERINPNIIQFGAVMIVPVTSDKQFILASEYAVGTEKYELSLPKGAIDENETPEMAANRELQEEIGVGAKELHLLGRLTASPNFFTAAMDIVLAKNLFPATLPGDEPEPIEAIYCSIDEIDHLISQQKITEARSIAALYLAMQWLIKNEG